MHEYCCFGNRVEALRVVNDSIFGVVTDVEGHFANSVLHQQILKWTLILTLSAKILSPFGERVLRINDSSNYIGLVGNGFFSVLFLNLRFTGCGRAVRNFSILAPI